MYTFIYLNKRKCTHTHIHIYQPVSDCLAIGCERWSRKTMGKIQLPVLFGEQIHPPFATTDCFPETLIARKFSSSFFLNESHAFIQLDNNGALCPGG